MKNPLKYLLLWLSGIQLMAAQESSKLRRDFGEPILADSSTTIMIPIRYDAGLFASDKPAAWWSFYSNIVFYNFNDDSRKRLFANDTYILSLTHNGYNYPDKKRNGITSKWVFYRVMNVDRNKNGKIDGDDPVVLYVSDLEGNQLKALTSENENLIEFFVYEKQNFALLKTQRDKTEDHNFTGKDNDYYFIKLDLNTLSFGKNIELLPDSK